MVRKTRRPGAERSYRCTVDSPPCPKVPHPVGDTVRRRASRSRLSGDQTGPSPILAVPGLRQRTADGIKFRSIPYSASGYFDFDSKTAAHSCTDADLRKKYHQNFPLRFPTGRTGIYRPRVYSFPTRGRRSISPYTIRRKISPTVAGIPLPRQARRKIP